MILWCRFRDGLEILCFLRVDQDHMVYTNCVRIERATYRRLYCFRPNIQ